MSLKEPYVRFYKWKLTLFDDFALDVLDPGINAEWWVQMPKLVEDGQLIVPQGYYFAMGITGMIVPTVVIGVSPPTISTSAVPTMTCRVRRRSVIDFITSLTR